MPPRPLHRWKSFWLGVIVVVFLGWAWARSMGQLDAVRWFSKTDNLMVSVHHFEGQVTFTYLPRYPVKSASLEFISHSLLGSGRWFPWAASANSFYRETLDTFTFSHWLLILLFHLPWTTWLVGRSRRMKRLAPGSAGLQTGSNRP